MYSTHFGVYAQRAIGIECAMADATSSYNICQSPIASIAYTYRIVVWRVKSG